MADEADLSERPSVGEVSPKGALANLFKPPEPEKGAAAAGGPPGDVEVEVDKQNSMPSVKIAVEMQDMANTEQEKEKENEERAKKHLQVGFKKRTLPSRENRTKDSGSYDNLASGKNIISYDKEDPRIEVFKVESSNADTRESDHINLEARTVNDKTFMSFPDPNEFMWGGSYYETLNSRPQFNFLKKQMTQIQELDTTSKNELITKDEAFNWLYDNKQPDDAKEQEDEEEAAFEEAEKAVAEDKKTKFGTWDGVFASCLLNIFGVIMFLRLPWVVGQAGVPLAICIIFLSGIVVTLTTLSMSAIATNGQVGEGGAYFMISRSLGPEVGGAIGVLFSIGMSVAVSMYVIGFCETMISNGVSVTGDPLNDTRILGMVILTVCLICVLIGIGWVIKLQLFLLVLLCFAIISFFIGSFANKEDTNLPFAKGWADGTFADNMSPDYREYQGVQYNFITVFGVFFPAVTGIMAGANISGDLENPSVNIPKGTLWSVGVSMITYAMMAVFCGAIAERGPMDGTTGLQNNTLIMQKMSIWGPLILIGVYAATFTSALASLVGAPRILMSVAKDNLISHLSPFAVVGKDGCGTPGNPIRGYFASYVVAAGCVAIGELNAVAPLITMFFMITYGLINLSVFMLELGHSPGWRPSFKYYNWASSLLGFLLCAGIMVLVDPIYAIISILIAGGLYVYIDQSDQDTSWGSAQEARNHDTAIANMLKLRKDYQHIKNYRPAFLVLTGKPADRPHLVYFGNVLRKACRALVVYAHVSIGSYRQNIQQYRENHLGGFVQSGTKAFPRATPEIKGFFDAVIAETLRQGVQLLSQLCGLGRLKPNVLVLGWKSDWKGAVNGEVDKDTREFVDIVKDAFIMRLGVMICRNMGNVAWGAKSLYGPQEEPDFVSGTGTIDVWWLCDDGGLTVLIPHLVSSFRTFKAPNACKIRLLTVVEDEAQWSGPLVVIQTMIKKFRLDMEVIPVETGGKAVSNKNLRKFEEISGVNVASLHRPKVTKRWLRVGELIRENSSNAKFIYITMPVPGKEKEYGAYLGTLDWLSRDLPPTVLMRGANQNVLTYYL